MAIACLAKKAGQDTLFLSTFQPSARGTLRKFIFRPTAMLASVNLSHRMKFHGGKAKHELGVAIYRRAARIESGGTSDCTVAIGVSGAEPFISKVLTGERLGIFRTGEDHYQVYFGPILFGHIDRKKRMNRIKPTHPRNTP